MARHLPDRPFRSKKMSYADAIDFINGEENKEEEEIVKNKANQMKNFMKNLKRTSASVKMPEKRLSLLRDLRFNVLLFR